MTTRRNFVARTTLAAAAAGLPSSVLTELADLRRRSARPYLDLAVRCGTWIERSAQKVETGTRWPDNPLKPEAVSTEFYNGMAGVVAFYAALADATQDRAWLASAASGGKYLIHEMDSTADLNAGLYSGLAGLGYTFECLERAKAGAEFGAAARRAADRLLSGAKTVGDGIEWSDSYDIISGSAGTGLFLLDAGRRWKDERLVSLAAKAGRALIAAGQPAEGGTMWFPAASAKRNYPNFSHGTSGVGYFLISLYQQTKDRAFLEAALSGVRYLDAVANRENGGTRIFHSSGGGENRYYLSWCHGPVGTARLFYRLHQTTGDAKWLGWVDSLTKAVFESGVPEQRTEGYWNNVSQCCGNIGIGQYCIDLARYHKNSSIAAYQDRIVKNTMARGTDDRDGLRWTQAENRTEPDNLVAQTGFMQGAAGIGTFLLQLDALERGARWKFPQPDTPFVG